MTQKYLKKIKFWDRLIMPPEMELNLKRVNIMVFILTVIAIVTSQRALLFGCFCGTAGSFVMSFVSFVAMVNESRNTEKLILHVMQKYIDRGEDITQLESIDMEQFIKEEEEEEKNDE